jgi:protein-ribulosamine 3-kinase
MHEPQLAAHLATTLGGRWQLRALGASAFCDTWEARQGRDRLFVKSCTPSNGGAMLEAEADGLKAIAATATVRAPALISFRSGREGTMLALEWLELAQPDDGFGERLATALAALHAHPGPLQPPRFGWPRDNFIGATPQRNTPTEDASPLSWIRFVAEHRLGAMRDRLDPRDGRELPDVLNVLIDRLPRFFEHGRVPRPSLIHGDLWQGNWGMLADGTPVLFDPAVSCSDAESELAMMELFGTPPGGFREAYAERAGWDVDERRLRLYQLYHLLNHAVLFGGSYVQQSLRCVKQLLA